jgi:ABC-type Fe3+/spermidine/putrescine transport system ATPase subunit
MIGLEGLSVTAGDFRLDRVTLDANDGEYLVLLGPSGAGKTVLLETIAGLRRPDAGRVVIGGRDMAGILPEHRGTALVYQDYSLFPHMTVAENVAYGLRIRKRAAADIDQRVAALLSRFRIAPLKDRFPGSLSGGEQQRVAIARALAADPDVLLLDEPFASLDPRTRDECIRVMQDVKETRAVTIIQVSHSVEEAYALADRAAVMLGGRIAQAGIPDEVFRRPVSREVAGFVGIENILAGTVKNDSSGRSRLVANSVPILLPARLKEGDRASIGIPARSIRVFFGEQSFSDPLLSVIPCIIQRVTCGKETVTLTLDGEISLIATMQRTPDDRLVPLPGVQVHAVFRDSDVMILSGT